MQTKQEAIKKYQEIGIWYEASGEDVKFSDFYEKVEQFIEEVWDSAQEAKDCPGWSDFVD